MSDPTSPDHHGDPAAALRRAAFLLERGRANTYKVKAFRGAADAVGAIGPDEVRARATAGSLQEIPGVGDTTAAVIRSVLSGEESPYLTDLELKYAGPLVDGGAAVLSRLRGDLHSHSDWSDGGSPIEEMTATAVALGREYQALTDHSPRLRVANGLSAERLHEQLTIIDAVNSAVPQGFRLLSGIEVDILDDGSLDQDDGLLAELDVVVASVHSKLKMDSAAMTRRMVAAVRDPHTDVLGHCTGRLVEGGRERRPQSQFDARAVFTACAEQGVAVEINSRPERCDPPDELVELALELGCLFSVDTDAHAPGQLSFLEYGAERVERLGVPLDRVVTSWPLERLLDWTGRDR